MSLNFAIWIKTQYFQSNLHQNAITPGVVQKIVQYFFFLNKPILPLECMNSRMFLPLYSIERMGNIYRGITQCFHLQFSCFGIQPTEYCFQPLVSWSKYCVLVHSGHIYRLQMWIKMQRSVLTLHSYVCYTHLSLSLIWGLNQLLSSFARKLWTETWWVYF